MTFEYNLLYINGIDISDMSYFSTRTECSYNVHPDLLFRIKTFYFILKCSYVQGAALMQIVEVYKETQIQQMNIVSKYKLFVCFWKCCIFLFYF